MLRKNIDECYILDITEVNQKNIEDLFVNYGDFITIFVCDKSKFQGLITYGRWSENSDGTNIINEDCQWLFDSAEIFSYAKRIFAKNRNIRTIPIINVNKQIIGSIEKYNSDEELEKELLEETWKSFVEVSCAQEMKEDLEHLKEILLKSNYLIKGKNYLTEIFCKILNLNYPEAMYQGYYYNDWNFAIDMDIKYSKIRKKYHYYGSRYVYSFYEFIYEITKKIQSHYFTGWYYVREGFYDLKSLLKNAKTESITIKPDVLMTAECMRFFEDSSYPILKNENINDYFSIQTWWGNSYKSNNCEIIEFAYREYETIQLYYYIKELNIKILGFYMPQTLMLNEKVL